LLDLFFTNNDYLISKVEILDNISEKYDHFAISIDLNLSKHKLKNLTKEISYFTEENLEKVNNELFSINWENLILEIENIDQIYDILYNKFVEIVDNSKSFKKFLLKITITQNL
jgi:hypothetical protein